MRGFWEPPIIWRREKIESLRWSGENKRLQFRFSLRLALNISSKNQKASAPLYALKKTNSQEWVEWLPVIHFLFCLYPNENERLFFQLVSLWNFLLQYSLVSQFLCDYHELQSSSRSNRPNTHYYDLWAPFLSCADYSKFIEAKSILIWI